MRTLLHHLVGLLLLCTGVAWGQECKPKYQCKKKQSSTSEIIHINPFDNDKYPTGLHFRKGNTVKFKISNVNVFKVKGSTIESKGENFQFDVPKIFSELNKVDEKTSTNNDNAAMLPEITTREEMKKKIEVEYRSFLNTALRIEQKVNLSNELDNLVGDNIFLKDTCLLKKKASEIYNKVYDDHKSVEQNFIDLKNSYVNLKSLYDEINDNPTIILSGTFITDKKEKKFENVKITGKKVSFFEEEMKSVKKAIDILDDEKKKAELSAKVSSGKTFHEAIQRENFVYYTDAEQLNTDEVTLTPILKGEDDKELHKFGSLTVKTHGGVRVNFSAGYMLSFIGNDEFVVKYNKEGEAVGVSQLTKNAITHAVGGLAHVLWGYNNFSYGLSAGLSTNTDAKLNFYGGASLAFLEKNRLVFTLGISYTNVQRLNRSNLNEENEFISPKLTDISYTAVYKPAWFFGVTYNLSNNGK
ncbi:hypothetical protein [Empedobacter brevis]